VTRVLIVTNFLSPYRTPLLASLAAREDLEIMGVSRAESAAGREWKSERATAPFDSQVLPGIHWSLPAREFHLHVNWGLFGVIRRFRPDVILTSGYEHFTFLRAMLYAKLLRKPFVFWFESTLLSAEHTGGLIGAVKRFLVRRADAIVAFGSKAQECALAYGASPQRVFVGLNTVDMDRYRRDYRAAAADSSLATQRTAYPPVVLLYVGRLIPLKNTERILEAFARVDDPELGLVFVGSGPEQPRLEAYCAAHGVRNVRFEGFHQQAELPRFYALGDVLILASLKEVWGLVVNEALASGLYVLCSTRAGAGYDLLRDRWNGRLFDPYSVDELADCIRDAKARITEIRARREEISEHACREFGIERSARAFVEAFHAVRDGARAGTVR
jgi:glycosyltransferase involved in cell wall biosynthesis